VRPKLQGRESDPPVFVPLHAQLLLQVIVFTHGFIVVALSNALLIINAS